MNNVQKQKKQRKNQKNIKDIKVIVNPKRKRKQGRGRYQLNDKYHLSEPVSIRNLGFGLSGKQLRNYVALTARKNKMDYLVGMLYPDVAQQQGLTVKCHSDVNIPTCTFSSHVYATFTTNTSGNMLLSWRPKLFVDSTITLTTWSAVTMNNNVALLGTGAAGTNTFALPTYKFGVSTDRYRLVSALFRVSYVGSVVNMAGTMYGCATFDELAIGRSGTDADTAIDRFGDFSIIQNGLWNKTSIIANNNTMEFLYVPMDPDDQFFEKTGYWNGAIMPGVPTGPLQPDGEGAHIGYVCAVNGAAVSSPCVRVDVYSNYEVIVDDTVAPIIRNSNLGPSQEEQSELMSKINQNISSVLISTPPNGKPRGYANITARRDFKAAQGSDIVLGSYHQSTPNNWYKKGKFGNNIEQLYDDDNDN